MPKKESKKDSKLAADNKQRIGEVEKKIGLVFKDKQLILNALTHRSFVKDKKKLNFKDQNERLEFLGDAVLGLVAAHDIFQKMPNSEEGVLTQLRAQYICKPNLAETGRRLRLGEDIRVAKAMRNSGPVDLPSVLADVMEALFGAAFLDQGLESARKLIFETMGPVPLQLKVRAKDPKTLLQERFQSMFSSAPSYELEQGEGPLHEPQFVAKVIFRGKVLASATGTSKKEATQSAAEAALLEVDNLLSQFQG